MSLNDTLTSIAGIQVGHYTDSDGGTGCTVVVLPEPNVVACEVRGAAPASRETALLAPGMSVQEAHAILLTGGSAFGLAAADGLMTAFEQQGRGVETKFGVIPIVPTAAIYDLGVGDASVRPTGANAQTALAAAGADVVAQGLVGAGTGAVCGKWRGERIAGGLGSASVTVGDATVAALVVVNALGDAFSLDGASLTGGPAIPGPLATPPPDAENTTLAVVATDAALSRAELGRLLVRSHDAFGACLRPAHTGFDGDICFGVSAGTAEADLHNLAEGAFEAVGRAIENAVAASG